MLAGTNPQYGSRKLRNRKQAERAARKGKEMRPLPSLHFGQMGRSAQHGRLTCAKAVRGQMNDRPSRLTHEIKGSLHRFKRPGRRQRSLWRRLSGEEPQHGVQYELMFYMRTLDGRKLIIVGSMLSYGSVPWRLMVLLHRGRGLFSDLVTWVDLTPSPPRAEGLSLGW